MISLARDKRMGLHPMHDDDQICLSASDPDVLD